MLRIVMTAAVLIYMSACSTIKMPSVNKTMAPSAPVTTDFHQYQLEQIQHYTVQGKIAIKAPKDTVSAKFHWRITPNNSRLVMKNILGITLLTVEKTLAGYTVNMQGKSYFDKDGDKLLKRLTGLRFPIEQFPLWIKGQHSIRQSANNYYHDGTVKDMLDEKTNWLSEYKEYQLIDTIKLPKSMVVTQPETRIKLRIDKWQITR